MDVNIVYYVLLFQSLFIGLTSLLINYMEPYLPVFISRGFRFGRSSSKTHHSLLAKLEISKKCFGHYYIISGPILLFLFCFALNKYFYNENAPEIVLSLLDTLFGTSRKALVSVESVILAIFVFSIHIWKRIYEMYYICVFSDQKINIFHYILTFSHYTMTLVSLIGESEGFVRGSHTDLSSHKLTIAQLVCAIIFLWSTYIQLKSNFILASLRKNQYGDVVTKEHKIPIGGLFNYISNPLQLSEIIIYLMLSGILWQASTFHYVTLFVMINQIECAILYDQWYRTTFKNYPKERKILIPYIW
ncbi:polyprenol reductase-like [Cataglyphis hispanica]|uniref:polyprenol reductase-like n=1 Tax=Cataglyphis hispanica TaxID=1086592 RepID=UPI0021807DC5|nr:polyprenol reductase-like [Cataglyphis hispanica]XP_050465337.1 polyprenol reductase-like [Cataglyphis hispanica]XP_050465338.1 polyprenol reductase-like [Cataglyphis hispanica]